MGRRQHSNRFRRANFERLVEGEYRLAFQTSKARGVG